jgi:hypothetical protein
MSNQIVISSGAKVRELNGVLTGTSGVVNALGINVPSGIPQLDGSGKILVSQLPNSVMEYKGTWNAATNTPTLADGTGNQGDVYLCNVAGTVDFGAGPIVFFVGDQVIYSGTIWQRASGATGTVTSVAVTESGDALTITGSPITTSGTINIGFTGNSGQYVNGAGGLTTFPTDNITGSGLSGQVTYFNGPNTITGENAFNYDASNNRLGVNTTVPNATIGANAGTDSGYSLLLKNDNANYNGIGFGTDSTYGNLLSTEKLGTAPARNLTLLNQSGYISITEVGNLGVNILNPNTGLDIYNGTSAFLWLHTANSGITGTDGVRLALFSTNAANLRNFEGAMSITSEGDFSVITIGAENFRVNSADGSIYQSKVANALLKSVSGVITAAVAGTDYVAPASLNSYVPYTGATTNVNLGTFDLTADVITGATGSFASNGSGNTFAINHSSGSGIALNITKGGNGEGLYINKTSGSGNAATIIGTLNATTIVKSGGTSSQYLMADGSVTTSAGFITGSGVDGRVPYFDGTNSITSEAGFIYDASTNRLGVNTSVPNATIGADAALNSGYGLLIKTGASNYNGIGIAIDSTYGNTIETAKLGTASARNLTLLNQSGFISLTEAGNLGVNILTPNFGIDIYNSTQSQLWLHNNASGLTATDGVRLALFNNLSANLRNFDGGLSLTAEGDFQIITIGAENLRVNSANGFVGIGNPASLPSMLTVNGGATISGLTTGQILFPTSGGTLSGSANLFWDNTNSRLGIGTNTTGTRKVTIVGDIDAQHLSLVANAPALTLANALTPTYFATFGMATATNNFITGAVAGDLCININSANSIYFGNSNTSTQRMRLTASGDLGIGASNPDTKLDVRGEISLSYSADNGLRFYNQDRSNWSSIGNNTATGTSNANLVFRTSAGTALTIAANRNTTFATAATFLSSVTATEIGSSFGIYVARNGSNTQGSGPYLLLSNAAFSQLWYQQLNASNGLDYWYNGSRFMTITSGGNVGIGTDSPATISTYKVLQVAGPNTSTGGMFRTSISDSSIVGHFYSNSTGVWLSAVTSHPLIFETANTERMRIDTNGCLNIGTTGGFGKLDVGGQTSGSAQNICRLGNISGVNNGLLIQVNSSNNYIYNFGTLGTGTVVATANVLSATSDMNLKVEDGYIDNALEKVLKLKPRYFYWKEETGMPTDLRQLGFYAQEVNEAIGEEVANSPKNDNEKWGIYDRGMIAFLTAAIQEQQAQIEELKALIAAK